jgi:glutaredoxin 3
VDIRAESGNFAAFSYAVILRRSFSVMTSSALPLLYIKPGCPWCHEVTEYLAEQGIAYRELDVMESPDAFVDMKRKSGQSRVPTLDWHGKILADFGVAELVPFLRKQDVKPGNT